MIPIIIKKTKKNPPPPPPLPATYSRAGSSTLYLAAVKFMATASRAASLMCPGDSRPSSSTLSKASAIKRGMKQAAEAEGTAAIAASAPAQ